jgi:putative transposase
MPWGLKCYYGTGSLHFITCSCYRRQPLLGTADRRDLLLSVLEQMRQRYRFAVVGYVVMPEHVHLLISEPQIGTPSTVMQAIKLGFARRVLVSLSIEIPTSRARGAREMGHPAESHRIWKRRFYDFNLWSQRKESEKLHYMHLNPVERGLVARPEDWEWSSFLHYATGCEGRVEIESEWVARQRERAEGKLCPAVKLPHSSQKTA